jgi:hypothetical protein
VDQVGCLVLVLQALPFSNWQTRGHIALDAVRARHRRR